MKKIIASGLILAVIVAGAGAATNPIRWQQIDATSLLVAADSGTDFIFNTKNTRTAGKLVSVRSNGTEKAYIDKDGTEVIAGNMSALFFQSPAATACTVKGNIADGAGAVAIILDNTVTLATAGAKLLSVRNNGTEKANIDKDGIIRSNAGGTLGSNIITGAGGVFLGGTATAALLEGQVADGATAYGAKIGNVNTLSTLGAKIVGFFADALSTEKAYITQNGTFITVGTVGLGRLTVADANVTWALSNGGIIEYTSLTAARTVTLPTTSVPTGTLVMVKDGSGNASATLAISAVGATGNVDGAASVVAVNTAYGSALFYWNGTQWLSGDQLNKPVEIAMFVPGKWSNSQLLMRAGFTQTTIIKASLPNMTTWVGTTAAASTVATIFKRTQANSQTSLGTLTWGIGARNPTVSFAADVSFAPGEMIEIIGQTTADTALADTTVSIQGWRK